MGCGFQIAWARVREIGKALRSLGFVPIYRSVRAHGLDFLVEDTKGNLVTIMEVTNYNDKNFFSYEKAKRTKTVLGYYPSLSIQGNPILSLLGIRRVLVASFKSNYAPYLIFFLGTVTDYIDLGFQTVPTNLYKGYPHLFQNPLLKQEGKGTQRMTTVVLKKLFAKYGITP